MATLLFELVKSQKQHTHGKKCVNAAIKGVLWDRSCERMDATQEKEAFQMFDWNHNGKQDAGDSFMDFMLFNAVMNGGHRRQKGEAPGSERDWIDELEELDALDDEDD